MPAFSETTLAFATLILAFGAMLALLRLKAPLWLAILSGCFLTAVLSGMHLTDWLLTLAATARQPDFLIMEAMIFGIIFLSGLQQASGQSGRLVDALEHFITKPRIRLVIFPALIGLLPMPGGALFSCPMLETAARNLGLKPERKAQINYWFRHIWECAWPLYPGYILTCSLLDIPLTRLMLYTFPLVFLAFAAGWFFLLRDLAGAPELRDAGSCALPGATEEQRPAPPPNEKTPRIRDVLCEALPIILALGGAFFFSALFSRVAPALPTQSAFIAALSVAVGAALWQGRGRFSVPLARLVFNRATLRMLVLVFTIYAFKDTIAASGVVSSLSHVGGNILFILLLFVALPLLCGLLTGLMVGFVGTAFPILIGILSETHLQEHTLPLMVLAIVAGNVGQLLSPLHVCLVVTCEFFKADLARFWRGLFPPVASQLVYGLLFALCLYGLGLHL